MLLQSAIDKYLASLNNSNSQHTARNYSRYLKRFLDFTGNIDIQKLELQLINKYHDFLNVWTDPENGKSLKPATKNYYLIALRSFINFLKNTESINVSPNDIFLESQEPKRVQVLDQEQLEIILKAPDMTDKEGLRDKLILEILSNTGLKVSELVTLNTDSLNIQNLEIILIIDGKVRLIKLPESVPPIFNAYMIARKDTFTPLFIRFQGIVDSNDNGEKMRLSERSIERIVQKYGKKAGIDNVTPQMLRNSLAANLLKNGEDVIEVAQILGHTNSDSTKVYARLKVSV